jgi:hypothetical protein
MVGVALEDSITAFELVEGILESILMYLMSLVIPMRVEVNTKSDKKEPKTIKKK